MKAEHYLVDVERLKPDGSWSSVMTLLTDKQINILLLSGYEIFNYSQSLGTEPVVIDVEPVAQRLSHSIM
jgi:hypothetical protein